MKPAYTRLLAMAVVVGLLGGQSALAEEKKADTKKEARRPAIQLAILLDTSGSMNGLINQARTQLWKIVNELATAKQGGLEPDLKVALYEYGKSSLPRQQGFLRKIVPLTDDLDKLSEELFALTTNGGDEYCGQVIQAATKELEWSEADDDLKLIFIAGNEAFTQGQVKYKDACAEAIAKGITVNTIFCGPQAEGIRTGWQDGAKLADGSFLHIDQNRQVAAVKTPFDSKLAQLSSQVNRTYVAFGKAEARKKLADRQVAQDKAAQKAAPAAAAERAAFKGSGRYRASAWDLIDALKGGKVKLEDLKDEDLPKELQKKSLKEKKVYLKKKEDERAAIQAEIQKLHKERKAYIAKEREKQATADKNDSLDAAIIKAIRSQAGKKKFEFEGDR